MARQIIAVGKWKTINFKNIAGHDENLFEDLIGFKELSNYEIRSIKKRSKKHLLAESDDEISIKKQRLNAHEETNGQSTTNSNRVEKKKFKKLKKLNKKESKLISSLNNSQTLNTNDLNINKTQKYLIKNKFKESLSKINEPTVSDFQKIKFSASNKGNKGNKANRQFKNNFNFNSDTYSLMHGNDSIESSNSNRDLMSEVNDDEKDMSKWLNLHIPKIVLKAMSDLGFNNPTPIQAQSLPYAIRDKADIIGAAQTGSGKTLAFIIPILHHILEKMERNPFYVKTLYSVIITPTRELAMQIKEHFEAAAKYTDIKCIALVGGMSIDKQSRLLRYKPDVIVATPGRFWELIEQKHEHLENLDKLECLVIDEADRLIQQNHYKELTQILSVINNNEEYRLKRQNFVYSATLTFVHDKPKRLNPKKMKKLKDISLNDKLATIASLIGLRDKRRLIDLTTQNQMTDHLKEFQVRCTFDEKDILLYYLIKYFPCRRLVFTNSKDAVRRINKIFTILGCKVYPLHADMQQKQRLKNLDKFKGNQDGILLATDVAARGLDITDIQQIVHYHVPKTTEIYVHRSGRTARSDKSGSSIVFISPQETQSFKKILSSLKRINEPTVLEINNENFSNCKSIVKLAIQIEKEEHSESKFDARTRWFKQAAIDAELDSDENKSESDEEGLLVRSKTKSKLKEMHHQLSLMLNKRNGTKRRKKKKVPTATLR